MQMPSNTFFANTKSLVFSLQSLLFNLPLPQPLHHLFQRIIPGHQEGVNPEGSSGAEVLRTVVYEQGFGGIEVVFAQDKLEDFRVGFAEADEVGVVDFFEEALVGVEVEIGPEVAFDGREVNFVDVAEQESAVSGLGPKEYLVVNGWDPDEEAGPGGIDVVVAQVWRTADPAHAIAEFRRRNTAGFELIEQFVVAAVREKLFYVLDAQLGECLLGTKKVDEENDVAVIEDDVFNVLHNEAKIRGSKGNLFQIRAEMVRFAAENADSRSCAYSSVG